MARPPITHFRSLFLASAPLILPEDQNDRKTTFVQAFVNSISPANRDGTADTKKALTDFCGEFPTDFPAKDPAEDPAERDGHPQKPTTVNIGRWIDGIRLALVDLVVDVPGAPVTQTLYIITMPEFGLNGREEGGRTIWNGGTALTESLETYIANRLHKMLCVFAPARILFAMSCCSFTPTLFPLDSNAPGRKVAGVSRITLITSDPAAQPTASRVYKNGWNPADKWDSALYKDAYSRVSGDARTAHVRRPLAFPGDPAGLYVLSYSTCQDVQVENHGNTNLCVYVGSGLPLYDLKDNTHPFIINDQYAWTGDSTGKGKPPGFYHFISPATDAPPVGSGMNAETDRFDKMFRQTFLYHPAGDPEGWAVSNQYEAHKNPEVCKRADNWLLCWYQRNWTVPRFDDPADVHGVVQYRVTNPIPFLPSIADAASEKPRRCSIL